MSDFYETDILAWSEHQAELLRQYAARERSSPAYAGQNEIGPDWSNIAEEIESVGREQLHAVGSLLFQALVHILKAEAWPLSSAVPGWQAEARGFRAQARRRFAPSMRQRIDLAGLYSDALNALPDTIDGMAPQPVPTPCPFTLDQLLAEA